MHFLDANAVNGSKQVHVSSHAPRVESVISSDQREVFTGSKGVKMLTVAVHETLLCWSHDDRCVYSGIRLPRACISALKH